MIYFYLTNLFVHQVTNALAPKKRRRVTKAVFLDLTARLFFSSITWCIVKSKSYKESTSFSKTLNSLNCSADADPTSDTMNFLDSAVCLNLLLCYRLIALLCRVIGSAFTNKTVHAPGHTARSSGPVYAWQL